ncbi:DNA polymerase III subunit delta' [Hyphomicrobium sp.]|uniref:DNA polymerase III subunit delta' n=1 Tax=Hyphomicrobium sp. TaxID=82 RepID=UPI000FAC9DCB|nr:DNA polymerase III subunit delta' [Hyphomicrobium sp.]RUP10900.1 MAG: DNA polymerase III subunit delta' [Hyphomicrobium sp.]
MARAPLAAETEVLPEADRLDDFPHPRETRALYGQEGAQSIFAEALAGDRMHHAWLLSGPAGVGKATLAYQVAKAALAEPEERDLFGQGLAIEPDSRTDRQVRALSHPSLMIIRRPFDQKTKRFPQSIPIDEVRKVKNFLAHSATGQGRRVVIVDTADELNQNAANALLKSLEEPPSRTIFLMTTSAPGRLLATIRSRCRTIQMGPLAESDLKRAAAQALTAAGKAVPEQHEWETLAPLAEGSVGRALVLLGGGGLSLQSRIDQVLSSLPRLDLKTVHALSDELQPAAQDRKFQLFMDLLQTSLARLISAAATGKGPERDVQLAKRLIGEGRLATFAELWETLAREKADVVSLNLDRKSLILGTFARLEAASRG